MKKLIIFNIFMLQFFSNFSFIRNISTILNAGTCLTIKFVFDFHAIFIIEIFIITASLREHF